MSALAGETVARLLHASLLLVVGAVAWWTSRGRREHRVVAALFAGYVMANVVHLWLDRELDAVEPPYARGLLAAYYADHAATLLPPVALVAAIYSHFLRRPWQHVAVAYAALLVFVLVYKESTGASLVPVHEVVWVACAGTSWAVIARTMLAGTPPDWAHVVLMLLAGADTVRATFSLGAIEIAWIDLRDVDVAVLVLVLGGYGYLALAAARPRDQQVER